MGFIGSTCTALPSRWSSFFTSNQGLITPIHNLAHRKPFSWDMLGGCRVSVTKTAQVELRSGRVEAPASINDTKSVHRASIRSGTSIQGPADVARHVIRCFFTQETRIVTRQMTWRAICVGPHQYRPEVRHDDASELLRLCGALDVAAQLEIKSTP